MIDEPIVIPKLEEERKNWRWDSHGRRLPDAEYEYDTEDITIPDHSGFNYNNGLIEEVCLTGIDWESGDGRKIEYESIAKKTDEDDLDSPHDWLLAMSGVIFLFACIILLARLL